MFVTSNLLRLKSDRHETRHVGPLGTREGSRPNGFSKFLKGGGGVPYGHIEISLLLVHNNISHLMI